MSEGTTLAHDWFPRALPANVVIGERSWCYSSFAFLHYRSRRACGVRVGRDSGIYSGSFFDLGPDGEVVIGDFVTLVGAIISVNSRVEIGDHAFIAHQVVLADSFAAVPQADGMPSPSDGRPSKIVVGRNSWIGARATILAGVRIGEGAIVGAGAVVEDEVPPFTIAAGVPARIVGSIARVESAAAAAPYPLNALADHNGEPAR